MTLSCITKITSLIFARLMMLTPLWWLFIRIWIAVIFIKSGLTKIEDFETTTFLFAEEYQVPLLSPYIAALFATMFELLCPIALIIGLGTRAAVLPLLVMTAVIQFTYLDHLQHYYWAILLVGLLLHGAGTLSLDHLITRRYKEQL